MATDTATSQAVERRTTVLTPDGARLATWVREPTSAGESAGQSASESAGPPAERGPGHRARPTVVLAHGWTLDHTSWDRVADLVQQRTAVRVVSFDQRGHGGSTRYGRRNRHPASVRELGDDLDCVISAVAPDGPLVLAGHSMGGMTVMAYAGRHPDQLHDRVRGAVLVSTAAGGLTGLGQRGEVRLMRTLAHLPLLRGGRMVTAKDQRRLLFGDVADPDDVEATRRLVAATRLSTVGAYYAALSRHDELAALAEFAGVPTRVLVGELDRLTPVHHARQLAELLPDAELVELPRIGHMLGLEAPDIVADQICELVEA